MAGNGKTGEISVFYSGDIHVTSFALYKTWGKEVSIRLGTGDSPLTNNCLKKNFLEKTTEATAGYGRFRLTCINSCGSLLSRSTFSTVVGSGRSLFPDRILSSRDRIQAPFFTLAPGQ